MVIDLRATRILPTPRITSAFVRRRTPDPHSRQCTKNLRTLNQAYVEVRSLAVAQEAVRRTSKGAWLEGRPVAVGLSSQRELFQAVSRSAAGRH